MPTHPSVPNQWSDLWDDMPIRARIAAALMVLSDIDERGHLTRETITAAQEGVGAFHGPPLLGRDLDDRLAVATEANRALHGHGAQPHGLEPLIGANTESGLSYTLGRGGTDVPYAEALGRLGTDSAARAGHQVGSDLAGAHYDMCLGPVLDVRIQHDDPVIGVRAFGDDPECIGALGSAFIEALQAHGIWACAKHFPGHGDSSVDSHFAQPRLSRSAQEHEEVHLHPYRSAIASGVASIMTAHVILPTLGVSDMATFSPAVNRGMLREHLDFEGVVVSDSLRMRAVSAHMSPAESVVRAIAGGCDIANVKCPPGVVPSLLDELELAHRSGALSDEALRTSFIRIRQQSTALQDKTPMDLPPIDEASLRELVTVVNDEQPRLPVKPGDLVAVQMASAEVGEPAEPLQTALDDIGDALGVRLLSLPEHDTPPRGAAGLIVLARAQGAPSPGDVALVTRAEQADIPSAVLMAGPATTARRLPTTLRGAAAPCIDGFGILSRPTAAAALASLLDIRS